MEWVLIEILKNTDHPVLITTGNIIGLVDQVFEKTKTQIHYKNYVFVYFTEDGWPRQRKMHNTFEIWVLKDQYELQEAELKKLGIS